MGALHAGHQSLIQRAQRMCQTVVVSIFVNPLQFGPTEDFQDYPRELSQDLSLCRKGNVDVVFIPQLEDLYPKDFQTTITVKKLSKRWEGEHRPTHFQGVTTIVTKLLNLVRPTRTFFGQKDYQQFLVIRQLVKDLELNTKLTLCPTIRDSDGLALSSRNQYLTPHQRQVAVQLYQGLSAGKRAIQAGERSGKSIRAMVKRCLAQRSLLKIDYVAISDALTLEPTQNLKGEVALMGAIRLGKIRLIDNVIVRVGKRLKARNSSA